MSSVLTGDNKEFTLLVIDDMSENIDMMKDILQSEYNLFLTTKPKQALKIVNPKK